MSARVVAIQAALLLGLCACGNDPGTPYVVLRIEDPANVSAGATLLVLTDASGNPNTFSTQSRAFPVTVTLTSKRDGAQIVTVELFAGTLLRARGSASVDVVEQRGQQIVVELEAVTDCAPEGCEAPPSCTVNADCQDDLYCNGAEVCDAGVCLSGPMPCGEDECDEQNGCGGDRPQCGQDLPPCDDGLVCNGTETCASGQCVTGEPPAASAACRSVICDERQGVRETLAPDGTACTPSAGAGQGVCYAGNCEMSPHTPQCHMRASFDVFTEGTVFGGSQRPITVNGIRFLESDASADPSWTVRDDDLQPGSGGAGSSFVLAIANDYFLRSFRIRLATEGQSCAFETNPAAVYDVQEVASTSFITITLQPPMVSGQQIIRFNFDCNVATPGLPIRIDEFCLLEKG